MSSPGGFSQLPLCNTLGMHPPEYSETFQTFSEPPPAISGQVLPSGTASPLTSLQHLSLSTVSNAVSPKIEEDDSYFENAADSPPGMMVCELVSTSNPKHSRLALISD